MKNRILVTGAGGQLGKELNAVSSLYPRYEFVFFNRQELSVNDADAVNLVFDRQQPSFCINCAAYTAVDKAETEKETAFAINGEAVGLVAKACSRLQTKLIHISTDYVFDGAVVAPYSETDKTSPVNLYGASKLKGEELALKNNADTIIIRTSWLYSAFGNNFVKTMIRLMREREKIQVVNDQVGCPTYAADLAGTIMNIITTGKWESGIYHYSNKGIITWYEFAQAIKAFTGSNCEVLPIISSGYPTPAKRPVYSVLNKDKIQNVYKVTLADWKISLAKCIEQLKDSGF